MGFQRFLVCSINVLSIAIIIGIPEARAQVWSGGSVVSNDWTDGNNWIGGGVPGQSSVATFNTSSKTSVFIDTTSEAAGRIEFGSTASSYTFGYLFPSSNFNFNLGGTTGTLGTDVRITNNSSTLQRFDFNIAMNGSGARAIQQASSGSAELRFNGRVTNNVGSLTITNSGAGAINFNGSGTALTSNGGFSIANNSTGNVTLQSAAVSAPLTPGSSPLVSVGGTGNSSVVGTLANSSNNLTLEKAGSGTFSVGGITSAAGVSISNIGSGATTIGSITNTSGNVSISNTGTATVNVGTVTGGGNFQVNNSNATGVVRLTNNVGATSVAFSGGGRVEVASGVTVSGTTTVSGLGSTLSGLGSFGNAVTIQTGGTLSPGVGGAGSLAFTNGLSLNDGSTFSWDLTNETTGFDSVAVNGALTVGSTAASVLNITGVSSGFWNSDRSWNVFTGNFTGTFLNPAIFGSIAVNGAAAPTTEQGFFTWTSSPNNVTLNFTAVPEPSSMALLGVAGLVGGVYARRRQKLAKKPAVAC